MSSSKATMSYCNDMFSSKEGEIVYNSSLRNTYRECRGLPNCVRIGQVTKPTLYILIVTTNENIENEIHFNFNRELQTDEIMFVM